MKKKSTKVLVSSLALLFALGPNARSEMEYGKMSPAMFDLDGSAMPRRISTARFENAKDGFNLQYPSAWERARFNRIMAFIAPLENEADIFQENVNVITQPLEAATTLESYTREAMENIRLLPGAEVLESGETRLGGGPAYRAVFRVNQKTLSLKYMQVWTVHAGKAVVINYSAEERHFAVYADEVQKIMESFQFIDTNEGETRT